MKTSRCLALLLCITNLNFFSLAKSHTFSTSKTNRVTKPTVTNISKNKSLPHKRGKSITNPNVAAALTTRGGIGGNLAFAKEHPFAFQLIIATVKTALADVLTQTVAQGKPLSEVDWKRNAIFVLFGCAYLGCFQWYLMVDKYRQWFPTMDRFAKMSFAEKTKDREGQIDAFKMALFDVVVHLPLIYFPVYYSVKEFVGGDTWNPIDWVVNGCTKYRGNLKEDLVAMIKLWGPADCIQFVLPMEVRMPFRHLISFFWTAYVSFTRGSIDTGNVKVEEG